MSDIMKELRDIELAEYVTLEVVLTAKAAADKIEQMSDALLGAELDKQAMQKRIAELEKQLSTAETFVATLQEQEYAWDELEKQLAEQGAVLSWMDREAKGCDGISESSKQVYSEYLWKCEALGMPDTANKDAAVSMAIVGSRCRIEEIEIVSGFVASQSAKMAVRPDCVSHARTSCL